MASLWSANATNPAWVFEEPFTIFTTDEQLLVCHGYNNHVGIL